jgi:AcrR family transcriptional regulator
VTVNVFPGTVGHMSSSAAVNGDDTIESGSTLPPAGGVETPVAAMTPLGPPPEGSRRDRRTARTRQAILDAARELIDEHGYNHTTVDQIAERADVAPRTFFRHFASKEALLFAHFEEQRRQMIEMINAQPTDLHPLQAVLGALADFCDVLEADHERYTWAFQVMDSNELHYEQSMLKAETADRISACLAQRLDIDPATTAPVSCGGATADCRPHAWAFVALTLFGNAMKAAFGPNGTGKPREAFETLVEQTGRCFERMGTDRTN